MTLLYPLLAQAVQMSIILALSPLLIGLVRKVKARLQRRRGAPLIQPYRDLRRLLNKEAVVADNASWIFRVAPYFIFASTWVAAALIPTFAANLMFSWSGDLIAITALLGSARFALALKAALADKGDADGAAPAMIFDEVDQGVGGAVADAVAERFGDVGVSFASLLDGDRGDGPWANTDDVREVSDRTRHDHD